MSERSLIIVGLGNRARQGKDIAAQAIIDKFGGDIDVRRYAFADALKTEIYDLLLEPLHPYWNEYPGYLTLPHPRERTHNDKEKLAWVAENKEELTRLMQHYGTEYVRSRNAFHWVMRVRDRLRVDKPRVALITDTRFLNELAFIRANRGHYVKVVREGFVAPDRDASHRSEAELDNAVADWTITCADGAIEELRNDACSVFEQILELYRQPVTDLDPDVMVTQES